MELPPIMQALNPTPASSRSPLSALHSLQASDNPETESSLSLRHHEQSFSETSMEQGSMMMMQQTRTLQYTSLRVQLAASEVGGEGNREENESYRAQLQAGLERLISDTQRPLKELLESPLLSDGQVVSVEYFSLSMIETTTMMVRQSPLPTVDSIVDLLRDRLTNLMEQLFPGYQDSIFPDIRPQERPPVLEVLPQDGEGVDEATPSVPAQGGDAAETPSATRSPEDSQSGERNAAEVTPMPEPEDKVTSADPEPEQDAGMKSIHMMAQRFSFAFHASLQAFQERMRPFQAIFNRHPEGAQQEDALGNLMNLRDLSLYQSLDDEPRTTGTVSGEG